MRGILFCFGVILPALALGVEWSGRACAGEFFNPIPTPWHGLLIALVPLANMLVLWFEDAGWPRGRAWIARLNGMAIGIALIYTIAFLPLMPLGLVAAIFLIGLLPLAPAASLLVAVAARRRLAVLTREERAGRLPAAWLWAGVGVLLLLAAEMPLAVPRVGLSLANSDSPRVRAFGLDLLRRHADPEIFARVCLQRNREFSLTGMIFSLGSRDARADARQVFYRVTGQVAEDQAALRRGSWLFEDRDRWERGPRADGLATVRRGLRLTSSHFDVTVDAPASVGYLEWTLVFRNGTSAQQEAEAVVQLPPGGVVSRLTLWVDGEPREAAFSGTSEVRAAYDAVVRRQQDPVLVTHDGPDRVRVQCFPVPPNDGSMKIRFGVTAPLAWREADRAAFRLPHFLRRNFDVEDTLKHQVWAEAGRPLRTPLAGLKAEQPGQERHALRGPVTDAELSSAAATLQVPEAKPTALAWARDPRNKDQMIVQEMRLEKVATPRPTVLVVEGSAAMASHVEALADALVDGPENLRLLVASGDVLDLTEEARQTTATTRKRLEDRLRQLCAGGQDNVPALEQAWDLAAEQPGSAIVWVHAAQPLVLREVEALRQRFRRRPDAVRLIETAVRPGRDRILEELKDVTAVQALPRLDSLQNDLRHLLAYLAGKTAEWTPSRRQVSTAEMKVEGKPESSGHLTRLWAREQVTRLLTQFGESRRKEAVQVAAGYQLVTLVTGAVVLETEQQFKQANLQPVDATTVPQDFEPGGGKFGSAPEPEVWLLAMVAVAAILGVLYWKRRPCAA